MKYKDRFSFENPGNFRISLKEAIDGGMSDPRNAALLKMFSMIDIGERAGSGIPGVFSVWNKEFGIVPEYSQKILPERTITTLKLSEALTTDNVSNDPVNDLVNDPVNQVLETIKITPNLSYTQIALKIGKSPATVKRALAKLKEMNLIKRVGSDKSGHWEVL